MSNIKRDTPKKRSKGATTVAPPFRNISEEFFYEFLTTVLYSVEDKSTGVKHILLEKQDGKEDTDDASVLWVHPKDFIDHVVEMRIFDEASEWAVLMFGEPYPGYAGQFFRLDENRLFDKLSARLHGWFLSEFQCVYRAKPVKEPPTKGTPSLKVVK